MPPPLDVAPHQRGRLGRERGQQNSNPFLPQWDEDEIRRQQNCVGAREIWNRTRTPSSTWLDVIRAIAFELQPVRWSMIVYYFRRLPTYIRRCLDLLAKAFILWLKSLQWFAGLLWKAVKHATWKNWALLVGVVAYLYILRQAHRYFHAGPMVVVLTGLVIIFTVGLDDDNGSPSRGRKKMSAYSVFNRHCRAILGSIDVESLVNQYVGGGMGAVLNNQNQNRNRNRPPEAQDLGFGVDRADVAHRQNAHDNLEGNDDIEQNNNNNNVQRGRARRSGKKARRDQRTLEQRRDRQRQRQEAAAMGFGPEGNEQIAMNRLVEQQVPLPEGDNNETDDEVEDLQDDSNDEE